MADPISIFPLFVKDQVYPPTGGGAGVPVGITVDVEVVTAPVGIEIVTTAVGVEVVTGAIVLCEEE